MDKKTTLVDIANLVYKRRKIILIATLTVSFLTAIVMLFFPNYYKATTVFYSASADLSKPDLTGDNMTKKNYYGNSDDIDRLLTVANSSYVKDYLISKYHLYEHYDIDSTKKKSKYKIRKKLEDLYTIVKNDRDAIELSIEDKDKVLAADMANEAREVIKNRLQDIVKNIQQSEIEKYKNGIGYKTKALNKLKDSIDYIKAKYLIYDPESQGENLTEQLTATKSKLVFLKTKYNAIRSNRAIKRDSIALLKANISGYEARLNELDSLMNLYNTGYALLKPLAIQKNQLSYQLAIDMNNLEKLEVLRNSGFKVLHLVEKAEVPLRKYRPKRSLYVIGAFLLALIFSVLIILAMEEIRKIKQSNIV